MTGVCKFCGCTEFLPCVLWDVPGDQRGPGFSSPCAWLLEDVCDAPKCVERAYLDARLNAEELTQRLEEGMRFEIEPGDAA